MINQVLLSTLMSLSCPKTKVVNLTHIWTPDDQNTLEYVSKDCKNKWADAPCLKKFTKKEENVYDAICGKGETK